MPALSLEMPCLDEGLSPQKKARIVRLLILAGFLALLYDIGVQYRSATIPFRCKRYKGHDTTHIEPMAEDLHEGTGLEDGTNIDIRDLLGLQFAATKGVKKRAKLTLNSNKKGTKLRLAVNDKSSWLGPAA